MHKVAVINASPLILLSRAGRLDLLRPFAARVLVPQPVAEEVRRRGALDPTARALRDVDWLPVAPSPPVPVTIREWNLGAGESAVLAVALENPGIEAIIDDLSARKCASTHGIPVRGTLGIVLAAKQRGVIVKARPVLEELLRSGLYLSKTVLDEALQRVDE